MFAQATRIIIALSCISEWNYLLAETPEPTGNSDYRSQAIEAFDDLQEAAGSVPTLSVSDIRWLKGYKELRHLGRAALPVLNERAAMNVMPFYTSQMIRDIETNQTWDENHPVSEAQKNLLANPSLEGALTLPGDKFTLLDWQVEVFGNVEVSRQNKMVSHGDSALKMTARGPGEIRLSQTVKMTSDAAGYNFMLTYVGGEAPASLGLSLSWRVGEKWVQGENYFTSYPEDQAKTWHGLIVRCPTVPKEAQEVRCEIMFIATGPTANGMIIDFARLYKIPLE